MSQQGSNHDGNDDAKRLRTVKHRDQRPVRIISTWVSPIAPKQPPQRSVWKRYTKREVAEIALARLQARYGGIFTFTIEEDV